MSARTYQDMLRDVRWQKKRLEVLQLANWKCEECERNGLEGTVLELQVHHIFYLQQRAPWDYPNILLKALCAECHKLRKETEEDLFLRIATIIRDKKIEEIKQTPAWHFVGSQYE